MRPWLLFLSSAHAALTLPSTRGALHGTAVVHTARRGEWSQPPRSPGCRCREEEEEERRESEGVEAQLRAFLETPLIDPETVGPNESHAVRWFKALLKADYAMAESLYAGAVFAVLLFFSQQSFRLCKHCFLMPDAACPWDVRPHDLDIFSGF
ncbi:hypothetical protein AB1Y20_013892 [Prymnesium parvum]|uniref:Uncharacterized protein n=1 Tax=Prymnesium parvum TaxID=97485 RepID=A0AB34IGN8_PRYPA